MSSNPRHVLALDLSTSHGQIAIVHGERVVFEAAFLSERSHNAQLFSPLQEALESVRLTEETVIAIGTGPGSYTGVRIAIAAAHGLSLSRGWPVLGWSSIATGPAELPHYRVLGDARRGQYYSAEVRDGVQVTGPEIMNAETATALVQSQSDMPWLTFDAKAPLLLDQVAVTLPSVLRLAQIVAGFSEEQLAAALAKPLEPAYLQEAFITTPRKAGKQVPGLTA